MRLTLVLFLIALKNYHKCVLDMQTSSLYITLLKILYKEGFIRYFNFDKKFLLLFLYTKKDLFKQYKTISTSVRSLFLNARYLHKHHEKGITTFVSTTFGVLTLSMCKKKNIGGLLLFQI